MISIFAMLLFIGVWSKPSKPPAWSIDGNHNQAHPDNPVDAAADYVGGDSYYNISRDSARFYYRFMEYAQQKKIVGFNSWWNSREEKFIPDGPHEGVRHS